MGIFCCSEINTKSYSHFNIRGISESDNQVLHFQYGVPIDTKRLYYIDQIRRTISQRRMANAFSYDRRNETNPFHENPDYTISLTAQELYYVASASLKITVDILSGRSMANQSAGESVKEKRSDGNNNTDLATILSENAGDKQTSPSQIVPLTPLMPPAEHYDRQRVQTDSEQITIERLVAAMGRASGCLQAAATHMIFPNGSDSTLLTDETKDGDNEGWQIRRVSWLVTLEKTVDSNSNLMKKKEDDKQEENSKKTDESNITGEKNTDPQGEAEVNDFFELNNVPNTTDSNETSSLTNRNPKHGKRVHFDNESCNAGSHEGSLKARISETRKRLDEAIEGRRKSRVFPSTTVEIASVNYSKTKTKGDSLVVSVVDVTRTTPAHGENGDGSTPTTTSVETTGETLCANRTHNISETDGGSKNISSKDISQQNDIVFFHVPNKNSKNCSDNSNVSHLRNLLLSSEMVSSPYLPSLVISAQWWYFLASKSLVPSDHPYFRGYVVPPIFARLSGKDASNPISNSFIVDSIPPDCTPTVCSSNYNNMKSSETSASVLEVSLDEDHCVYGETLNENLKQQMKQTLPVGPPVFPNHDKKTGLGKKSKSQTNDQITTNKNAPPKINSAKNHLPHSNDPLADLDLRNLVAWPPTASPANPSVAVLPGRIPRPKKNAAPNSRASTENPFTEENDNEDESVVVLILFAHRRGLTTNCTKGSKESREFSRRTQEDAMLPMSHETSISANNQFHAIAGGSKPALKKYRNYMYGLIETEKERKAEGFKKLQPGRESLKFPLVGGCGDLSMCCPEKTKDLANTSQSHLYPYSNLVHPKCFANIFQSLINASKQPVTCTSSQLEQNPFSFSPYSDQGGWVGNGRYTLATSSSSHLKRQMLHHTNTAELRLDPVSVVVEAFCVEMSLKRKRSEVNEKENHLQKTFLPPAPLQSTGNETVPGISATIGAVSNSQGFLDIVKAIGREIQNELWAKDLFPL